ncbi:MAG TPA: cobalamin-binding protein [Sphingobacteriaceae bacterium]|nr:cobalamin-binding protein [Sphingobacteriaceae bacterium]
MKEILVSDQLNRDILIPAKPLRIISLVPSQTELLFDLGLDNEIIGITKFCIHPKDKTKQKAKIGGTKALDIEKIRRLNPDLIIGNKEENEKDQIESLAKEFPVWMSDIYNLKDAIDMISEIGSIVGRRQQAKDLAEKIASLFNLLPKPLNASTRVAYFIWKNPYMVAANNTFIDHIMHLAGWKNAINASRYPEISAEELKKINPDVILLSSEPYPFKEKHIKEFQKICPGKPIIIVDGELFSWYGSRLQYTPSYLQQLQKQIHEFKG